MPLYKNNTTERLNILGTIIEPGETKATNLWLDPLPAGVTKIADAPIYNPIIYSALHTAATTIAIPSGETRFNIHIAVTSGELTVKFSSASASPALVLYNGARWNTRCYERAINDIRLSGTFNAYVIIERF